MVILSTSPPAARVCGSESPFDNDRRTERKYIGKKIYRGSSGLHIDSLDPPSALPLSNLPALKVLPSTRLSSHLHITAPPTPAHQSDITNFCSLVDLVSIPPRTRPFQTCPALTSFPRSTAASHPSRVTRLSRRVNHKMSVPFPDG